MRYALREAISYLLLITIISSVLTIQIYQQAQNLAYYKAFERHAHAMDEFLEGWTKYNSVVHNAEVYLSGQLADGVLPPFSCEAVFIRRHVVATNLIESE